MKKMQKSEVAQMLSDPFTPELRKRHCQPMRSRKATGQYEDYVRVSDVFFVQLRAQWQADRDNCTKALKELFNVRNWMRDHCGISPEDYNKIAFGLKPSLPEIKVQDNK